MKNTRTLTLLLAALMAAGTFASCGSDGGNDFRLGNAALNSHGVCQQIYRTAFYSRQRGHCFFNPGRAGGTAHAGDIVLFRVIQPPLLRHIVIIVQKNQWVKVSGA